MRLVPFIRRFKRRSLRGVIDDDLRGLAGEGVHPFAAKNGVHCGWIGINRLQQMLPHSFAA